MRIFLIIIIMSQVLSLGITNNIVLAQTLAQTNNTDKKTEEFFQVSATILPEKFILKKLLKNHANIQVLVNAGADPHSFEPKPKQLMNIHNSSIYFSIGLPIEQVWLTRFKELSSKLKEVKLNQNIALLPLEEHGNEEHGHSHESEGNIDPHIWTTPENLKIMAQTATKALRVAYPNLSDELNQNLSSFTAELKELDKEIKTILSPLKPDQKTFIVFHPAFNYFAKSYGLKELVVEQEGREPNPKQLVELSKRASSENVKLMIIQKGFSISVANTLAKHLNINVIELDPLSENLDTELIKLANALVKAHNK